MPFPRPFVCFAVICFFNHAWPLFCTVCSVLFARRLLALCCSPSCWLVAFFCYCRLPLSRYASCLVVPSSLHARTTALHMCSGLGASLCSCPVPSPSWGLPLGRPKPCQVGVSPSRPSPLFPLFSSLPSPSPPLSLARPLTVALLLRVLSAGLPRARTVSRALPHASGPPPCPLSCRPTWAASPDTPSGGFPRRAFPPASPPSAP